MTVAALEALELRNCLSRGTTDLPRRFFRATAKPIGQAWQLAAGGDLSLPEIQAHHRYRPGCSAGTWTDY